MMHRSDGWAGNDYPPLFANPLLRVYTATKIDLAKLGTTEDVP